MAFTMEQLSAMATTGAADGNTLYYYSNSAADDPLAAGYFNAATQQLRQGDLILDGATGRTLRVSSVTGAAVVTVTTPVAGGGGG